MRLSPLSCRAESRHLRSNYPSVGSLHRNEKARITNYEIKPNDKMPGHCARSVSQNESGTHTTYAHEKAASSGSVPPNHYNRFEL